MGYGADEIRLGKQRGILVILVDSLVLVRLVCIRKSCVINLVLSIQLVNQTDEVVKDLHLHFTTDSHLNSHLNCFYCVNNCSVGISIYNSVPFFSKSKPPCKSCIQCPGV